MPFPSGAATTASLRPSGEICALDMNLVVIVVGEMDVVALGRKNDSLQRGVNHKQVVLKGQTGGSTTVVCAAARKRRARVKKRCG